MPLNFDQVQITAGTPACVNIKTILCPPSVAIHGSHNSLTWQTWATQNALFHDVHHSHRPRNAKVHIIFFLPFIIHHLPSFPFFLPKIPLLKTCWPLSWNSKTLEDIGPKPHFSRFENRHIIFPQLSQIFKDCTDPASPFTASDWYKQINSHQWICGWDFIMEEGQSSCHGFCNLAHLRPGKDMPFHVIVQRPVFVKFRQQPQLDVKVFSSFFTGNEPATNSGLVVRKCVITVNVHSKSKSSQ